MPTSPSDSLDVSTAGTLGGAAPIPIAGRTAVAFVGRTERGPVDEPVVIESHDAFLRTFGGVCAYSFLPQAVQHFFIHGGKSAIVVRVANRATRALLEIPAGEQVLRLQARNPGSRERLRVSVDYDGVDHEPTLFNLVVQRVGRARSQLVEDQELYSGLSLDPTDDLFVVDVLRGSALVRVVGPLPDRRPGATRALRPGEPIPYLDMSEAGSDGDDLTDYDIVGSDERGTGLFALDRCDTVDLVCIPPPPSRDLGITSYVAAVRYSERRRALLVVDPPGSWTSVDAAVAAARHSERVSPNVVAYFPRVRPRLDAASYPTGLPACGVVAGILASSDPRSVRHRLPLGEPGLKGNLVPLVDVDARQAAMLNRVGVNALVRAPAGGAALQGNVTFAAARAISCSRLRLDTHRLALFIVRAIERHTRWASTAEPGPAAVSRLTAQVTDFLVRLQREGALPGASPRSAFRVRVSEPIAAPELASALRLVLRVEIALQTPEHFEVYDFVLPHDGPAAELRAAPLPVSGARRALPDQLP